MAPRGNGGQFLKAHHESLGAIVAALIIVGQGANLYQSDKGTDLVAAKLDSLAQQAAVMDYRQRAIEARVVALEMGNRQPPPN